MSTNAKDIATAILQKLVIIGPTATATNAQARTVLDAINDMIDGWANEKLMVYAVTDEDLTLTANQSEYTIGADGSPDFNTVRPLEIATDTMLTDTSGSNNIDYPVQVKTIHDYRTQYGFKSSTGRPYSIALDPQYPNAKLLLYPAPDSAYTLKLRSHKALTGFDKLTTDFSFPPGYKRAIIYNGCMEVAPNWGKEPSSIIIKHAMTSKAQIKQNNIVPSNIPAMEVSGMTNRGGNRNLNIYNIGS